MIQIAKFFTLYWCIYFPTCIAFNDLPGFSSVDEVMTGLLIAYTFSQYGKKIAINTKPWDEYFTFFGILIFYTAYSLLFGANVRAAVWYDLMQEIRPWSIIYCTWILNPQFTEKQKKRMAHTMLGTLLVFLVYHPETASNAFSGSTNRNAPFGQLAICTSMVWYLFKKKTKKNLYICTAIAIVGLLGMKFKYYGQFGAWMFMLYYMKDKFDFRGNKIVSSVISLSLLAFIVILLGWDRFNSYYIEGMMDGPNVKARPEMNKVLWEILWDYFPFGCGFGSYATAASAVYYSPIWKKYNLDIVWGLGQYGSYGHGGVGFHCDNFFATFGQIGWAGIFLFLLFWKRRFKQFTAIKDMNYYKVAMMSFFCIVIEWFGDSSFFSGKGMGYCMLIALCLNANRNIRTHANKEKMYPK